MADQPQLTQRNAKLLVVIPPLVILVLIGLFFLIIFTQPGPSMLFVAFLVFVGSLVTIVLEGVALRRLKGGWVVLAVVMILLSILTLLFGAAFGIYPYVLNAILGY